MIRQFIDSSTIASAGFDHGRLMLEIEFKNGRVYQYFNVPFVVVEGLATAGSAGKYFNQFIRDRFETRKLGQENRPKMNTDQHR